MTEVTRQLRVLDDGDDNAMLRVAFATSDRKVINQHFGSASSFAIYGVNPDDARLLTVIEFGDLTHDEDKLAAKLELLKDCIAVYCRACGASAVRQLLTQGIQPVKVSEGATIEEMISALQDELRSGPSSWLAKALQRSGVGSMMGRFDAMESEGWIE